MQVVEELIEFYCENNLTYENIILISFIQLRKSLRFLLGNISTGSSPEPVDYNLLWPQDKYMLYQLYKLGTQVWTLGFFYILEIIKRNCVTSLFCCPLHVSTGL
jgi:hypothetical protein